MTEPASPIRILTYCPLPYNGSGPSRSCVDILGAAPPELATPILFTPRATRPIPPAIDFRPTLGRPLRWAPWRPVRRLGLGSLERAFVEALQACDPARTVAYFWPDPPLRLVQRARGLGVLTIRDMINCYRGSAKTILDAAYERLNLPPGHTITDESVRQERAELALYDYVFASRQVIPTLHEAGVDDARILPAAFGWSPQRFLPLEPHPQRSGPLRVLFVGIVGVRKGIPDLIEAWRAAGLDGELLIAGGIEPDLKRWLATHRPPANVRFLGFVKDMRRLYQEADIFVFPTYEEGGPQVTCEAAGCGLPVITTDMGAGRLIEHEANGLIVGAGDIPALGAAMARLTGDGELRARLGARAAADAMAFTYDALARRRIEMMVEMLTVRHGPSLSPARDPANRPPFPEGLRALALDYPGVLKTTAA